MKNFAFYRWKPRPKRSPAAQPTPHYRQQSNTSPATASRVTSLLLEESFLSISDNGSLEVTNHVELLRRWTQDYSFARTYKAQRFYSALGNELAIQQLRKNALNYRLTGPFAASEYFRIGGFIAPLPPSEIWIYAAEPDSMANTLHLLPDPHGNVLIGQSSFAGDADDSEQPVISDDLIMAEPWRVAGDLLSSHGRLASLGESLAKVLASDFQ